MVPLIAIDSYVTPPQICDHHTCLDLITYCFIVWNDKVRWISACLFISTGAGSNHYMLTDQFLSAKANDKTFLYASTHNPLHGIFKQFIEIMSRNLLLAKELYRSTLTLSSSRRCIGNGIQSSLHNSKSKRKIRVWLIGKATIYTILGGPIGHGPGVPPTRHPDQPGQTPGRPGQIPTVRYTKCYSQTQ